MAGSVASRDLRRESRVDRDVGGLLCDLLERITLFVAYEILSCCITGAFVVMKWPCAEPSGGGRGGRSLPALEALTFTHRHRWRIIANYGSPRFACPPLYPYDHIVLIGTLLLPDLEVLCICSCSPIAQTLRIYMRFARSPLPCSLQSGHHLRPISNLRRQSNENSVCICLICLHGTWYLETLPR